MDPEWWNPLAVRATPSPSTAGQAPEPAVAEVPRTSLSSTGSATTERRGARRSSGGTDQAASDPTALASPEATSLGTRRVVAAPGTADPVEELREALGFGPIDRERLAPRPEWAGTLNQSGMSDSSPQASADAPISLRTAASTRGTPLGVYVERAEELIAARWLELDLDPHSRAMGVQGDVTVRYLVHPNGRVTDVTVVRSSGNARLDSLATEAIPDHLARFPRALGKEAFHHQVTLRYRNPILTP